MSNLQLPYLIDYSFFIDLNITEKQIPYVNVSLIAKATDDDKFAFSDFADDINHYEYQDIWYLYGDGELIACMYDNGGITVTTSDKWRFKHIRQTNGDWHNTFPEFVNTSSNDIISFSHNAGERVLHLPFVMLEGEEGEYPIDNLPYNVITVKRNTGITLAQANAINPDFTIPTALKLDFPNMERRRIVAFGGSSNYKLWIKIDDTHYRLAVWGSFIKKRNDIPNNQSYEVRTCTYVPHQKSVADNGHYDNYKYYKLQSSSITDVTQNFNSYDEPNDLDKADVKLLVSFLNEQNFREQRILKNKFRK